MDDSLPAGQFHVEGFKTYRKDVTGKGGGMMMVVWGDIPQRRRPDMEVELSNVKGRIETMALEMTVKGRKWVYCSVYKQPLVSDVDLVRHLDKLFNTLEAEHR